MRWQWIIQRFEYSQNEILCAHRRKWRRICKRCSSNKWKYKERNGRQYLDTEIPMENIYILDRYYRTNKSIEQLKMMVVRIELMESEVPLPYSCVIYSLDGEGPDDVTEIKCVSHGNNKKAEELSQPYIRISKSVFQEMDTCRKNLQMYLTSCWGIPEGLCFHRPFRQNHATTSKC